MDNKGDFNKATTPKEPKEKEPRTWSNQKIEDLEKKRVAYTPEHNIKPPVGWETDHDHSKVMAEAAEREKRIQEFRAMREKARGRAKNDFNKSRGR